MQGCLGMGQHHERGEEGGKDEVSTSAALRVEGVGAGERQDQEELAEAARQSAAHDEPGHAAGRADVQEGGDAGLDGRLEHPKRKAVDSDADE